MSYGMVLRGEDAGIATRAKAAGLEVTTGPWGPPPYDKTVFVAPGIRVPLDMLPAGRHFLDKWDAVAPLYQYGVTGADVGSDEERRRTAALIRDLRVPLYAHELLFVRDNEAGRALMAALVEELAESAEPRLAFLRAFYRVKPRLCAVPATWLSDVHKRTFPAGSMRGARRQTPTSPLVEVEIGPGRSVKCHRGDEEKVLAQFAQQGRRRHGR